LATSAWRGSSSRSFVPQAIVTGIASWMTPEKGTAAFRIMLIAGFARRYAFMSPIACSGLTCEGRATMSA